MGVKVDRIPSWFERALQGVAFWIGHRHALYPHHPLSEGALVAEAANLIHANLPGDKILLSERLHRTLVPGGTLGKILGQYGRADLAIVSKRASRYARDENISRVTHAVIEMKKYTAGSSQIYHDLARLHEVMVLNDKRVRCFEIVVAESRLPKLFADKNGKGKRGVRAIPSCNGLYRVRRVCKATASFAKKGKAHYVCLLEVSNV